MSETKDNISFWDSNHPRQDEYQRLYNDLVPSSGEASTVQGELIRAISRLFYDYCNNGNGNVVDRAEETCSECNGDTTFTGCPQCNRGKVDCGCDGEDCPECEGSGRIECPECGGTDEVNCGTCDGSGVEEGELRISPYYGDMIEWLETYVGKEIVKPLKDFVSCEDDCSFTQEEVDIYNKVTVSVLDYCRDNFNIKRVLC
jgi:hypothetical protein